jgi:hypothetical protein
VPDRGAVDAVLPPHFSKDLITAEEGKVRSYNTCGFDVGTLHASHYSSCPRDMPTLCFGIKLECRTASRQYNS